MSTRSGDTSSPPPEGPSPSAQPEEPKVVDGTQKRCKGIIASLVIAFDAMEIGSPVIALVADVPSRIDVHAWADRNGHKVESDKKDGSIYRMVLVKGTADKGAGPH